jgi:hypothetical protein
MSIKFATAINCMDGRAQTPVIEYMRKNFNVDCVDMITEPGPNKILAEGSPENTIGSIKERVRISVEKHGSQVIAVVAHHDCAGNPEGDTEQKKRLKKAVEVVLAWGFPVDKIVPLWLDGDFKPAAIDKAI